MVYKLSSSSGLWVICAPWRILGADLSEAVALSEIWSLVGSVKSFGQVRLVDLLPWSLWPPLSPQKTPAQMWPSLLLSPLEEKAGVSGAWNQCQKTHFTMFYINGIHKYNLSSTKQAWLGKVKRSCSVMSDSVTPWTVAYHTPPSMGFSRQEY